MLDLQKEFDLAPRDNLLKILNSQILNDDGEVYILKGNNVNGGLTVSTSSPYTITNGFCYQGGEIFEVDAATVTTTDTLVVYKKVTYCNSYPTT